MDLPKFLVRASLCETCIYRKDSPLDIAALEDAVRDPHVGFQGFRVCHKNERACCRGFWNAHRDEFAAGQVAQRLGLVEFSDAQDLKEDQSTAEWLKGERRG